MALGGPRPRMWRAVLADVPALAAGGPDRLGRGGAQLRVEALGRLHARVHRVYLAPAPGVDQPEREIHLRLGDRADRLVADRRVRAEQGEQIGEAGQRDGAVAERLAGPQL